MSDHCKHSCGHRNADHFPHQSVGSIPEGKIPTNATEEVFRVRGMDCSEEIAAVEKALKPIPGILGIRANLMASSVTVYHDGSVGQALLVQAIHRSGLKIQTGDAKDEKRASKTPWLVGSAGVFTGLGIFLEWCGLKGTIWPEVGFIVAMFTGGALVFPKALRSLMALSLDMNVLMTVAVAGAVLIGQHAEGAAVVFLFSLSELLEAWSVGRARRAIQALMQLAPDNAVVKREGNFIEVPTEEVLIGETLFVKSGQKIPLDGTVLKGISAVDQAPITGESVPVEKKMGDPVYAGTINGEGSLEIRTTKTAGETTLSHIIKLVEEAQQQKAPAQRFVDVFAKYYTPAVMILALCVAIIPLLILGVAGMDWVYRALVLLVIACPCALVISTPVSIVSGLTAMARLGVLIKGGAVLEALGQVRVLALDKTGTITEGRPQVLEVIPFENTPTEEIIRIAAAIDAHSTHPLAQSVVRYATENNISFSAAEDYQAKTGRGAEATISGHSYLVGNHRFVHELGICSEKLEEMLAKIEADAKSVVVVGHRPHQDCTGEVLGVLVVGDTVRSNAAEAIARIRQAGIRKVVMLSGDNIRTVHAIAQKVGVDDAHGDLLPENKIERVRNLAAEFGSIAMIGDGVNDAPALAAANVGIAMGTSGTDTAIETADIALMRDDLMMVSEAIYLGRRTVGIIRFNIAFALVIKAVFLILALLGHTSLWLAVLADTGTTLLVIANALRLLRH